MLHSLHETLAYNHYAIVHAYNAADAHAQGSDWACWRQKLTLPSKSIGVYFCLFCQHHGIYQIKYYFKHTYRQSPPYNKQPTYTSIYINMRELSYLRNKIESLKKSSLQTKPKFVQLFPLKRFSSTLPLNRFSSTPWLRTNFLD